MSNPDSALIRFSTGRGRNLGKAKNRALPYRQFAALFQEPVRTGERFKDYLALPHAEQQTLKAANGWYFRSQVKGDRRTRDSALPTDIITLDFDNATPEFMEQVLSGEVLPEARWLCHSTRRHTEDKPRLRFIVPLASSLSNDDYGPISRIIAQKIDPKMEMVDLVSFRPAQMMFFPTASKDGDWLYHENGGPLLDWHLEADTFEALIGDWHDFRLLPTCPSETLRARVDKAEDPTTKVGPVGDFCRAYSVPEAIEKFLPEIYAPTDDHSSKPRYTYLPGTTANGAVIEDDGLFLYSHHGSDPCGDKLVNAFDLVRIHLFGDQDAKTPDDTPPGRMPSWAAMLDFLADDEGYVREQVASRYNVAAQFSDDDVEPDDADETPQEAPGAGELAEIDALIGTPPLPAPAGAYAPPVPGRRRPKPPKDWITDLDLARDGRILPTPDNVRQILRHDVRLRESIEFNEFTQEVVLRAPMILRTNNQLDIHAADTVNGDRWQDYFTSSIRILLSAQNGTDKAGWGLTVPAGGIDEAVEHVARELPFHPIKDMLLAATWDRAPRLSSVFTDHLGADDNVYTRSAAVLFFVAAVARVFEPGHKFDFVPILEGPQGALKSTFVEALACGYFGELTADLSDERATIESMRGKWIMELPELSSLKRTELESVKAFITRTTSTVRMAYARREATFLRQCVFMGTTNEAAYLIDKTGNRRWWPIRLGVGMIDIDRLVLNLPQIWAEAFALYSTMRVGQPHGPLPLFLDDPVAQSIAADTQDVRVQLTEADHMAGKIAEWLFQPRTEDKFDDSTTRFRDRTCVLEIWSEALGKEGVPSRMDSRHVADALRLIGWHQSGAVTRFPTYGVQRPFFPMMDREPVSGEIWRNWWLERLSADDDDPETLI